MVREIIFTKDEKEWIGDILLRVKEYREGGLTHNLSIISFEGLGRLVGEKNAQILKKIRNIDPTQFGFLGPYFGLSPVPKDLVPISGQKIFVDGKERLIQTQYLPKKVYKAFRSMQNHAEKTIEKKIFFDSGYRSPAYQAIVFLKFFHFYDFDFFKTVKRVLLPGYSEHGNPQQQALDIINEQGIPGKINSYLFAETPEYAYLKKYAKSFGFKESYPKKNIYGIMPEPWHWRFNNNNKR